MVSAAVIRSHEGSAMIETRWWNALILYVKYDNGRVEVRLGVVCLLVFVVLVWKLVRAWVSRNRQEPNE
jgi:hypothetical protein